MANLRQRASGSAAHQRMQAGNQFVQFKRLQHIIIGTTLKSGHPFVDGIPGCQDQYRKVVPLLPPVGQHLQSITIR